MTKYITLFLTLAIGDYLLAQPFKIGHTTIDFVDASRSNRVITTEIYYPADVDGENLMVAKSVGEKFPVIAFGHGFVMTWDAYKNIWEAVVPQGYVIAFPKTESTFAPSHLTFGKDLAFVIADIMDKSQDATSIFYHRIDTMNCVMGHSMGGGSAFLAAQYSATVKTIATLAPAETSPSAIAAANTLDIPALIFAGGNDCITPPPTNQVPMYESLMSECKTYITIDGGSHCQMAESNLLCSFGENTCSPMPTISREQQHMTIRNYLIPWLDFQLKKNCKAGAKIDSLITIDTSIEYQKTCVLCDVNASDDATIDKSIEVYPSLFSDKIYIKCIGQMSRHIKVDLYTCYGSKIISTDFQNVATSEAIDLDVPSTLPTGIYVLRLSIDGKHLVKKMVH